MRLIDNLPAAWNQEVRGSELDNIISILLNSCLTFTYNDIQKAELLAEYEHLGIPKTLSSEQWFQSLSQAMSERFYDEIYVEREKCRKLVERFGQPEILTMCGYAGAGKSTLLRQIVQSRRSDETETIIYINAAKDREELSVADTAREQLAQEIYQRMRGTPGYALLAIARLAQFRVHRTRHTSEPHYQRLLDDIESYGVTNHDDYLEILTDPNYSNVEMAAWHGLTSEKKLRALLQYLKDSGHRTYLILDNLDRLPTNVQEIYYRYCQTLQFGAPALLYCTLALRTDNFHRLPGADDRSSMEIPHDIDLSVTLEPNARLSGKQQVAYEEISRIIGRRIDFCATFLDNKYFLDYVNSKDPNITQTQLAQTYQRYKSEIPTLLSLIKDKSESVHMLPSFIEWHNSSVRSICYHFYSFTMQLLRMRAEKETRTQERISLAQFTSDLTDRNLRTAFLRSVIFDNRHTRIMNTVNVFTEGLTVTPLKMCFLPLKVLQYVVKRTDPIQAFGLQKATSVLVGDIVNAFGAYQVAPSEIHEAIKALRRPRDFDPYGLIYIDLPFDGHGEPIGDLDSARLYLLPSGYFFWNSVSTTCEYVFWCACFAQLPPKVIGKSEQQLERQLANDRYRLLIALKFCSSVLIPQFVAELEAIDKVAPEGRETGVFGMDRAYCQRFGLQKPSDAYLFRLMHSLRIFFRNTPGVDRELDRTIQGLFTACEKRLNNEVKPTLERWMGA